MPHDRFSFETVSEPVSDATWTTEDYRRIPPNLRPGTGSVSPISPIEPEIPSVPHRFPSNRLRYQGNGVDNIPEEDGSPPPPPIKDIRPGRQYIPPQPKPSLLEEVRRTIDSLSAPEMVERSIPPLHTVTRKPVPESPRVGTLPYNQHEIQPPRIPEPAQWGNVVEIETGPRRPSRLLRENGELSWSAIFTNIVFLTIPCCFFALSIGLGMQDKNPTNSREHWRTFKNLMIIVCEAQGPVTLVSDSIVNSKQAGTAFPIAFAAVTGRAVLKIADFWLERGVKLGALEQIMGSRTFGTTISSLIQLRSFNLLSLGLLALWATSPIGSQAVLRLLSPENSNSTSSISMPYFNTDTESYFANIAQNGPQDSAQLESSTAIASMYVAALLTPSDTKNGTTDWWGNVKIPFQSSLDPSTDDWAAPSDSTVYSSLIGIPIAETQINSTTSFTMESSYMELACGNVMQMSNITVLQPFAYDITDNITYSSANGTFQGSNVSDSPSSSNMPTATWSLGLNSFTSSDFNKSLSLNSSSRSCQPGSESYTASPCYFRNFSEDQAFQGTLLFQSLNTPLGSDSTAQSVQSAFCQVQQIYVESNITCNQSFNDGRDCQVVAQRNSQRTHAPPAITPLSLAEIFAPVSLGLPRATGATQSSSRSDPSLLYLNNTSAHFIATAQGSLNLTSLPPYIFSSRLAQLLNTYYSLGQGTALLTEGGLPDNITTTGTITTTQDLYSVSWPWFAFFSLATMLMLLAAIVSVICDRLTTTPILLGYTSSIIRDSKYIRLDATDQMLSGLGLARKHRELGVKMGEVGETGQSHLTLMMQEDAIQAEIDRWNASHTYITR